MQSHECVNSIVESLSQCVHISKPSLFIPWIYYKFMFICQLYLNKPGGGGLGENTSQNEEKHYINICGIIF